MDFKDNFMAFNLPGEEDDASKVSIPTDDELFFEGPQSIINVQIK